MSDEPWMREPTAEENPDGLGILRDEEDEPCFEPIMQRAKARAETIGGDDAQLIRDLLAVIQYREEALDAQHWHMSDNGELPGGV